VLVALWRKHQVNVRSSYVAPSPYAHITLVPASPVLLLLLLLPLLLLQSGRVRPSLESSSVLVRLMCGSRQGQLEAPAWSLPLHELRLPRCGSSTAAAAAAAQCVRINIALHDAKHVCIRASSRPASAYA
jgi:hypothetical protein